MKEFEDRYVAVIEKYTLKWR